MLRTALTPKWLGLLAVVVLVVVAFIQLGRWQLGIAQGAAHAEAVERARATPPVELTSVLQPQVAFPGELSSRPVTAVGHYTDDGQFLVPSRRLGDTQGYWLMAPFLVESTGARIAVLRGLVTDPAQVATPLPEGTLTIAGGLAPGESPVRTDTPLPEDQLASVDMSVLVNRWPNPVYNAFLFLESQTPAGASAPQAAEAGVARVPTPLGDTGIQLRNAAYALQWWVFAGFAVWFWWRMVRDESRSRENGPREPSSH